MRGGRIVAGVEFFPKRYDALRGIVSADFTDHGLIPDKPPLPDNNT